MTVRIGITLPSFHEDPDVPLTVARAAEAAGLDGVFVFDHLFRRAADGSRRPALEGTVLLGAIAAETEQVAVGTLVARATLRPAATLAAALDTAHRVSGGRLVAGFGSGDAESREENESFGLPFGRTEDRVGALREAVVTARDRGYPVWVGGSAPPVRAVAAEEADGWNRWGGTPGVFARQGAGVSARATRPGFALSWGGLVVTGADDAAAEEKAAHLGAGPAVLVGGPERLASLLVPYVEAGATWLVLGPVDSSDPGNAAVLGEAVAPRLREPRDRAQL